MHVLRCTVCQILPSDERLSLRAEVHNGKFPFWPEHLRFGVSFDVPADADAADVWMAARTALHNSASNIKLPGLNQISLRRLRGTYPAAPGSPLRCVVLAAFSSEAPAFQFMVPAEGCPEGFGRFASPTVKVPWAKAI